MNERKSGYKLSNALLSPRLLRNHGAALLHEDVFSDDIQLPSTDQAPARTHSCSSMNRNSRFSSPSLGRAAARFSKMIPRKISLSSLLTAGQSEKLKEERNQQNRPVNKDSEIGQEPCFRSKALSDPVPSIQLYCASSSDSITSEPSLNFSPCPTEWDSELFSDDNPSRDPVNYFHVAYSVFAEFHCFQTSKCKAKAIFCFNQGIIVIFLAYC